MEITWVARLTDGLIFCESWGTNPSMNEFKAQARQLLKRFGRGYNTQLKCTIDSTGTMAFHYVIDNGVVFMTLCQKSYNKKLAFIFLEELARDFHEELKLEFGTHSTDYRSVIETIEKPYYFIKFDRSIQKKKHEFKDPTSGRALQKLNESLSEVTSIMRQNVEDILQRGEDLTSVSQKADDLKASSSKFAKMAKVLSFQAFLQKYIPLIIIIVVILLIVIWKFFL